MAHPPGFESTHFTNLFYRGPGIAAAEHFQNDVFDFRCSHCEMMEHVVVRSSEWSVNTLNGDARGIFTADGTTGVSSIVGGVGSGVCPSDPPDWIASSAACTEAARPRQSATASSGETPRYTTARGPVLSRSG